MLSMFARAAAALCLIGLLACISNSPAARADGESQAGLAAETDLETMLEKGLRARLPEEKIYVAEVCERVEEGQLPVDLVLTTFQWSRRKSRYPLRYFERVLKMRAAEIGRDAPSIQNPTPIGAGTF